jgi:hypothetical protein
MASRALLLAVSNALKLTYLVLKAACSSSDDSLVSVPAEKIVFIQSMMPVIERSTKNIRGEVNKGSLLPLLTVKGWLKIL